MIGDELGVFAHHVTSGQSIWLYLGAEKKPSDFVIKRHSSNRKEYILDTTNGETKWVA